MKKPIPFTLILCLLVLASCQKEYGYYSSCRLKVVTDLSTAISHFEEQNEGDLTPDKDHAVRIKYFLYDADGNLFADVSEYANDYYTYSKVHSFENVPLGEYTLIVATDVVERTGNGKYAYAHVYWEYEGVDHLSTFNVRGEDRMDIMGERLLTLTKTDVSITGRRTSQRVRISVEPVTAMVCTTFLDVFHWDKNVVPGEHANRIYNYFDLSYRHNYDVVTYNPSPGAYPWQFSESTTEFDYYLIDRLYPDNLESKNVKNIYGFHAVLPGDYSFTGYGEYTFSGNPTSFSNQTRTSGTAHFEAGGMYYVDFDIEDWSVALEGTAYSRSSEARFDTTNTHRNNTHELHRSNLPTHPLQRDRD